VVIDDHSSIDFSGYRHYIEMPSLRAWANAGFPYSRYADLAQTLVLVQPKPNNSEVTTLLNAIGSIGAQTGYPALRVQLSDDWSKAKNTDADLLMIGSIPNDLQDDRKINALVAAARSWINMPTRQVSAPNIRASAADRKVESQATISSRGPMGVIVGFQSPFFDQRSVVALLADSPRGWDLLNNAMQDSGKRAAIFGAASIIRESGVYSLRVGDTYYVGHLPWWERLWNLLAIHPVWLAVCATLVVLLFALMAWRLMRMVSRRRLAEDEYDE
jgi:cellulose synthase operon protein B